MNCNRTCHIQVLVISVLLALGASAEPRDIPRVTLLPAYAHNDYENESPLFDALRLGYRGVEADYFVVDGQLLVAHERDGLEEGKSIQALYLEPLKNRIAEAGSVYGDGSIFTLNIESKESGRHTYDALHAALRTYEDMLTVVRDGVEFPGPVQVVLVGWHPPVDELALQAVRYASVHCHHGQLLTDGRVYPSHLIRFISVNYDDQFFWNGRGRIPTSFKIRMKEIRSAKLAVSGRLVRVFGVPRSAKVYEALLNGGVDLIGTKTLKSSREILMELELTR